LIDDDLALVAAWGFEVTRIEAPVPLIRGGQDRAPGTRPVADAPLPEAGALARPHDGHVSILDGCPLAMDWLKVCWKHP
jgi:hypothetical protein